MRGPDGDCCISCFELEEYMDAEMEDVVDLAA